MGRPHLLPPVTQFDLQVRKCSSTEPAVGLATRRLRRLLGCPSNFKRFQTLPQISRRHRTVALELLRSLVKKCGQLPRLAFGLGLFRDVSVVRHVLSDGQIHALMLGSVPKPLSVPSTPE
jgi:hypothetical protein